MSKIIVFAAPVFAALILFELWYGVRKGRNTYRLADALSSIGLGLLSQASGLFTRLLRVGIYTGVYQFAAVISEPSSRAFWQHPAGWVLALVFYDLCYYWHHRISHTCALFWAAHVVHHQSEDYNLSTALRQTSTGALVGWVFYIPMAVAGVPPLVFATVALIDLLYQFWVHTEHVGRLGWFDRWFCSPSNHRVHHATNAAYLDKNFGGIWVFWDRLFGSFQVEDPANPCVYGTRTPLSSWDPLWANGAVYVQLAGNSWRTRAWADKLRVWLKPPGWLPPDLPAAHNTPAPVASGSAPRFDTPSSRGAKIFAAAGFCASLGAVAALLWWHDPLPPVVTWSALFGITTWLWTIGAVLQSRLGLVAGGVVMLVALASLPVVGALSGVV